MADTPVSPTNVNALPTAPNRNTQTDPLTYSQTADAWAGALPVWTTQVNNIAANVNFNADSAFDSAAESLVAKNAAEAAEAAAQAAQAAAEAASNATEWVSGQAYVEGDVVWSPINYLSYRANTNTSGTTDPSLSADWTGLGISLGTGVETFLGTPSSANLAAAVTDETGSGALVFATSPTLVTPVLGTPSSGTLSDCTVDGTDAVGFRNVPQNSRSDAYTLVLADAGKHILHPTADTTARTFTIPDNGSVAFPVGTAVTFINQNGAGVVTIAITTDTMRLSPAGTTGSRTLAANGSATAVKVTSTEWIISGSGLT